MLKLNRLYNADCLEGMKRIDDCCVDLVIADLPYGTTRNSWDKRIDLESFWAQIKRVIKENAAIIMFADMKFAVELINSNPKMFRYDLVWDKAIPTGFLNANRMPLRSHELMLVFYSKLPVYNPEMAKGRHRLKGGTGRQSDNYGKYNDSSNYSDLYYPKSIVQISNAIRAGGIHPTQKPVVLYEYLIKMYSNENDLVLDPVSGSGTIGIATINTKRKFIGFELDKEYYEASKERIKQHRRSLNE